jgi:hypothetical protein
MVMKPYRLKIRVTERKKTLRQCMYRIRIVERLVYGCCEQDPTAQRRGVFHDIVIEAVGRWD